MTIATDMLDKYMNAERAILDGKTVSFGSRSLTMENLPEIRKGRQEWETRVRAEASGPAASIGGLRYSVARFDR